MVAQEVVGLEVLEAEARAAGGVDLHDARDAERVRIVALCRGVRRRGGGAGGRAGGTAPAAAGRRGVLSPAPANAADIEIARAIAKALRITASNPCQGLVFGNLGLFNAALTLEVNAR